MSREDISQWVFEVLKNEENQKGILEIPVPDVVANSVPSKGELDDAMNTATDRAIEGRAGFIAMIEWDPRGRVLRVEYR